MLIERYIFRELAAPSLLGLVVYTAIFLVHWFFRLADWWTNRIIELPGVFQALLFVVPSILAQTIPMSVLLGVLIGFSRLSADSEITALRASGVSYYRLLLPAAAVGILAWGASSLVYQLAVPWANTEFVEFSSRIARRSDVNREIQPGTWVHLEGAHVYARSLDTSDPSEPWLQDVDIVLLDPARPEREHLRADRARINRVAIGGGQSRLELELEGLTGVRWWTDEREPQPYDFSSATRQLRQRGGLSPARVTRRMHKHAKQQTLSELDAELERLRRMDRLDALAERLPEEEVAARRKELQSEGPWVPASDRPRRRNVIQMEIYKKFSIPLACMVFALTALPLGIATRKGGRPASFVVSIGIIALWWIVYNIGEAWMDVGRLSPLAAAWLPDVVVGLAGLYLLVRLRRQQRLGPYRLLRDALLLGAGILLILSAFMYWGVLRASGDIEPLSWPLPAGLVLLFAFLVVRTFRDPVARGLAFVVDAVRRPMRRTRAPRESRPGRAEEAPLARPLPPRGEAAPDRLGRLERLRGALVFALLALLAVLVLRVVEHEAGLRQGLREALGSWEVPAVLVLLVACAFLQSRGVRIVKTLDWWLLGSYLKSFGFVLSSLVVLYVVIQYVEIASHVLQNDIGWSTVADFYVHMMPRIFFEMIPFSAMIAALVVFGVMTKFNETTALRCCGVSVVRLAAPVLLVAALLSCGVFVLHDYVLPKANARAEELKDVIKGKAPVRRVGGTGFVFAPDGRSLYLHDRILLPSDRRSVGQPHVLGLTVLRYGEQGGIDQLVAARDAVWSRDRWQLRAGWQADFSPDGVTREDFASRPVDFMPEPEYFAADRLEPDEMTFADYRRYLESQAQAGYATQPLEVKLQRRLAFPAASLVLVVVGIPFAFTTGRRGALYGIGIALLLGMGYMAIVAVFERLGMRELLPPMVAAWAPNALFALGGVFMMFNVRT